MKKPEKPDLQTLLSAFRPQEHRPSSEERESQSIDQPSLEPLLPHDFVDLITTSPANTSQARPLSGNSVNTAIGGPVSIGGIDSEPPLRAAPPDAIRLRKIMWEGVAYLFGRGRPKDPILGYQYLREAANAGYKHAQYTLGTTLCADSSSRADAEEGMRWLHTAAEARHVPAQWFLAQCFELGIGISKNTEQAMRWYLAAAQDGSSDAQALVGARYALGDRLPQDDKLAVHWYKRAAEQGDRVAQYELALLLSRRISAGEVVDNEEWNTACEFLQESARTDFAPAKRLLGLLHGTGRIESANPELARYWLERTP